jgi:hypothetical protein
MVGGLGDKPIISASLEPGVMDELAGIVDYLRVGGVFGEELVELIEEVAALDVKLEEGLNCKYARLTAVVEHAAPAT